MILRVSVFYLLTWFFLMLLGGVQQATGILPPEVGLPQWGVGIAAFLMVVLFRKDGHTLTFFSKTVPVVRYVQAAMIPLGAGLIVLLVSSFVSIKPSADAPQYGSLLAMVLWMPFGALGEEFGWRGYLHKKLDTRLRGLFSSVLVGVLWMPIHIAFLSRGLVMVVFLAVLIISYSIVLYALVQDADFGVLLASIFHLSINLTNLLFLDVIYESSFMMVNSLVWAVIAVGVVFTKKNIFLMPRE